MALSTQGAAADFDGAIVYTRSRSRTSALWRDVASQARQQRLSTWSAVAEIVGRLAAAAHVTNDINRKMTVASVDWCLCGNCGSGSDTAAFGPAGLFHPRSSTGRTATQRFATGMQGLNCWIRQRLPQIS